MITACNILGMLEDLDEAGTIVKGFAKKTGKSVEEVEKLWNKAQDIVKNNYSDVREGSQRFYKLVTTVLKNMLDLN